MTASEPRTPSIWKLFFLALPGMFCVCGLFVLWCLGIAVWTLNEWDRIASEWLLLPEDEYETAYWWAWVFSRLGDGWAYAITLLILVATSHDVLAVRVAAAVALSWVSAGVLKVSIRRKRFERLAVFAWVEKFAPWSFPSQHAATAAAFAITLWPVHPLAALFAALVCGSRVLIGSHYLGDVLMGAAVGIAAGKLV